METKKLSIEEIAELHELELIGYESRDRRYPRHGAALIGFETFAEAEEIAKQYGGEIIKFHRKDGYCYWDLLGWTNEPIKPLGDMYGDDYGTIFKMGEGGFYYDEIAPRLDDFNYLDELSSFIEGKKRLWQEIESMDDDEVIITYYGDYYDTLPQETMEWSHDTHKYVIGVYIADTEEEL